MGRARLANMMRQVDTDDTTGTKLRLADCTADEADALRNIVAAMNEMADRLPRPLHDYTEAMGEIRRKELGVRSRKHHRGSAFERRR
jgi:hypothetical protein